MCRASTTLSLIPQIKYIDVKFNKLVHALIHNENQLYGLSQGINLGWD